MTEVAAIPGPHPASRSSGKATAALVLGIVGLVLGFLAVPLAGAVLANVLGSLAIQEIDGSEGAVGGRGQAVAGMTCATVAIVLWAVVFALVAAFGET